MQDLPGVHRGVVRQPEHRPQRGRDIREVAGFGSSRKAARTNRISHGDQPHISRLRVAFAVVGEAVGASMVRGDQEQAALARSLELEKLLGKAADQRVCAAQRPEILGVVVDVSLLVGFADPDEQKIRLSLLEVP